MVPQHESKTYTVKNRNEQERTVLIEHPVRNEFKLVSQVKPVDTASNFYHFYLKDAPGKTESKPSPKRGSFTPPSS